MQSAGIFRQAYNSYISRFKQKITVQVERIQSIQFPEKYKGTILERWKDYWVTLTHDYADVAKETYVSAKTQPKRTLAILSLFGFSTYCFKTNPNETSYRDTILSYSNELILIGPTIRNPAAHEYLMELENYFNEGLLSRVSLGLFSLILRDEYNKKIGIFNAQCSYLKIPFYRFHERIVDVGFLNKWHFLDRKMIDFDINPEEWKYEEE